MAYNAAIPQPGDQISVSQQNLLNNFNAIDTFVNINHVAFNGGDQGKHKFLQMPEQGVAPTTGGNEAGLYAAVGAVSTVTELVFRRENNGASIPFTECSAVVGGWSWLPSGIMIQWGNVAINGNFVTPISFPRAFPTACFNVQVTENVPNAPAQQNFVQVVGSSITTTTFLARGYTRSGTQSAPAVFFYAIGH